MSIMVGLFCASIGKQGLIASESIEGEKIYNETQGGRRSAVQILRMRRARPTAVRRINNSVGFPKMELASLPLEKQIKGVNQN